MKSLRTFSAASIGSAKQPEPLSKRLRATGDLKLVPYLMAGHPSVARSAEVGRRLATSGIAALELGIPFSDPLADGPVIQRAGQVARMTKPSGVPSWCVATG